MAIRRKTRQIQVGTVKIGGDAPVVVQSMTSTDTRDVAATVAQIERMAAMGCEIVRLAVPDREAAHALGKIKSSVRVPLLADIHFDYTLALESIAQGVDAIRINPGNIGDRKRVEKVVAAAAERKIPIRVGVNAGSLEKDLLAKYGHPTPEAMVESALRHVRMLEEMGFYDIKISLKASNVPTTIEAYRLASRETDYPLHVGISEAGTLFSGTIKSAVGLGILLSEGIGNTIRISLAADPVEEVRVAYEILKSLNLRHRGINVIACPTCGRVDIDVEKVALQVEQRLAHIKEPFNVSVLGCIVNGIGEGLEADVGIAGGKGAGLLFRHGEVVGKVKEEDLVETLVREVEAMAAKRQETGMEKTS
jgi:(E)-4-hydroxy-3-methylbut-2-enyl-diphosphate synthase